MTWVCCFLLSNKNAHLSYHSHQGSGAGKAVITAAAFFPHLFSSFRGIELLEAIYNRSLKAYERIFVTTPEGTTTTTSLTSSLSSRKDDIKFSYGIHYLI